jgi:hypothetical protein
LDQEVLTGKDGSGIQVKLVGAKVGTGSGILNGIRRGREIDGGIAAIEDLHEVVAELRTGITAAGIQLANHQISHIVIFNRSQTLTVDDRGVGNVCDVHEKRFRWFDVQVAVYCHV